MARKLKALVTELARRVGRLHEARRPKSAAERARDAETLGAMALATIGGKGGPCENVTLKEATAVFLDQPDSVAGMCRIVEIGQQKRAKKGRKNRQKRGKP